ncbi:MAG: hypothetical protein A3H44_14355 [Gammaproteobacteria bacterium RIFCSPLOWO2_02_FULL_57_10]|nr:MAG: hypothetical protein A3H44_14355 [Gammaproteobacteria bacterium RIFCSPLOWO2_02_FULL_57_10]
MKSRFLILLSTLLLTLSVHAQPGSGPGGGMRMMNPEARVAELIAALEITPQQEPAFREAMTAIAQQQRAAMQSMRQGAGGGGQGGGAPAAPAADAAHDHSGDAASAGAQAGGGGQGGGQGMAMRADMQAQTEAALAPILTQAQMAKFREIEAARMAEMRERMMQRQQ